MVCEPRPMDGVNCIFRGLASKVMVPDQTDLKGTLKFCEETSPTSSSCREGC
jgi:hypothetical protein